MGYKEVTHSKILELYQNKGLKYAVNVAFSMLRTGKFKSDMQFAFDLHGEICESVLEIMVLDYCKRFPSLTKQWSYSKGLILKNRMCVGREFSTEIDFTLCTPQCIYIFECKSYSGEKDLVGNGLLTRKADVNRGIKELKCNVFKQSRIHYDTLSAWVNDFVLAGAEPLIQMCMFDFSIGSLKDNRSRAAKITLPYVTIQNLYNIIDTTGCEVVWDAESLKIACGKLEKISRRLTDKHLDYVKKLHGNGG